MINFRQEFSRDAILVGLIGFFLGGFFAFSLWAFNRAYQYKKYTTNAVSELKRPTPTIIAEKFTLNIASPEEETVTADGKIVISGKTSLPATIIVFGGEKEVFAQTDKQNGFSAEVPLDGGLNELVIIAQNKKGEEIIENRTVTYSLEEL